MSRKKNAHKPVTQRRRVDLVVDKDGDVIFVRCDHHSPLGAWGEGRVIYEGMKASAETSIITLRYKWPQP